MARSASAAFGRHGTVLIVPLDDLPDWLPAWCRDHLGSEPARVLFREQAISVVFGLRLADGRELVPRQVAFPHRLTSVGPAITEAPPHPGN